MEKRGDRNYGRLLSGNPFCQNPPTLQPRDLLLSLWTVHFGLTRSQFTDQQLELGEELATTFSSFHYSLPPFPW